MKQSGRKGEEFFSFLFFLQFPVAEYVVSAFHAFRDTRRIIKNCRYGFTLPEAANLFVKKCLARFAIIMLPSIFWVMVMERVAIELWYTLPMPEGTLPICYLLASWIYARDIKDLFFVW